MLVENKKNTVLSASDYSFNFTSDMEEINAYITLRNKVYKTLNGGQIEIHSDRYDRPQDILIVRKNSKIIGGARLTSAEHAFQEKLPLEEYGFNLTEVIQNIHQFKICECSRSFITPQEYFADLFVSTMDVLFKTAVARKCIYLFFVTRPTLIKHFERVINSVGYTSIKTSQKIYMDYNGKKISLYLCYVKLKNEK